MTGGWHGKADHRVPGFRPAPGGGDRCGTVCRWEHRRQLLRGHAAVSTSARRPGGRMVRGPQQIFAKIPGLGTTFKMLTKVWPLGRGTVSVSGNDIVVE